MNSRFVLEVNEQKIVLVGIDGERTVIDRSYTNNKMNLEQVELLVDADDREYLIPVINKESFKEDVIMNNVMERWLPYMYDKNNMKLYLQVDI